MSRAQVSVIVTLWIVLAGCAPGPDLLIHPNPAPTATQPACLPSPTQPATGGFREVRATMRSSGEVWALLFFDQARAGDDEKIVWRISGSGQPDFQAQNQDGVVIRPDWGPALHESSTWDRPGQEWGTGFIFPEGGCWTITVTHGATVGEIKLRVLAP